MSKVKIIRDKFYLLGINLALTFIVLLISMWAVRRSSRRTTLPIVMMNDTVRRLGEGDLAERISSPTDIEEIQQLAVGINQMAEQLQFERRQLEQKVQAATLALRQKVKEEEEANFNKTRFLAAASHDLRQPIHALGLFVGQIQELMVSAEQKQVAERIEKSVQAMSGLLDSLLDVSKLDAGVVVPHLQQVDLDSILRRLAADYSAISFEKNLRLSVAPTAYTVYSDPQLLARILGNLLSNAVRYTPRNGTIFIGCRRRGERVKIEVRDNGIGIEPSQHQAIFAEFVQLANKQRDRSQGLGLGLSIVQRLVSLLGHHLALKSAPNLGSTFTLELNLFDGQGQSALVRKDRRLLRRSNPKFTQQKILVVDDDGLVRESTKGIVESWGFQVTIAETVVDAIQLCQSVDFELVISDYLLPDGNGLQVAEYFKLHAKLPPKFILVTGDASPDILISINKLGFNVMNKPVRPANLRSLIVHLLNTNVSS
jgi:signal transduction histidine kinase/ActR/RegA family two-component response regulator